MDADVVRVAGVLLLALVLTIVGVELGLWWLTFVVAVPVGLALPRGALAGALVGALGWALPLAWIGLFHPLTRAAEVISGVMGFGGLGPAPALLLTVVYGLLLGLSGGWLGGAVRALVRPGRREPAEPVRP